MGEKSYNIIHVSYTCTFTLPLIQNPNTNVLKTIMTYNNKFKSTTHVLQFTNYSFYMIMFDDYGPNGAH